MLYSIISAITLIFVSWIVGILVNNMIRNADFYSKLSHFNFIKNKSTYTILGMHLFKWMIKHTFFKYFNQKIKLNKRPSQSQLRELRKEMTYSEISHLIGFIFAFIILTIELIMGKENFAIILFVLNIIFNLYPSLLQQQNKAQIDRILMR